MNNDQFDHLNEDAVNDVVDSDSDGFEESEDDLSWITWFCQEKGNEFFCEVSEDYIQDDFNLVGLRKQVPYYEYALDMILELESPIDDLESEQISLVEEAAKTLYGLIHARFILTNLGLAAMEEKFKSVHFGRCPRVYCQGQPCLPVGQSDVPRDGSVKLYCPKCNDIYFPRSSIHRGIDGSYFGTTFPHLFLMAYPELNPHSANRVYVPKIYGFKVHKYSKKDPHANDAKDVLNDKSIKELTLLSETVNSTTTM